MKTIEQLLDNSIERQKHGEPISTILRDVPGHLKEELRTELETIQLLASLQLSAVPRPIKRKQYLLIPATHKTTLSEIYNSVKIFGFAMTAASVVIIGGLYTAYAALSSLPGDRLFSLKRVFEYTQIQLTQNPQSKTELQLNLAAQRLADAQTILSANTSDQQSKQAAITELNSQTQVALNAVQQSASISGSSDNSTILKNAQALATNAAQLNASLTTTNTGTVQTPNLNQAIQNIQQIVAAANTEQDTTAPIAPVAIQTSGIVTAMTATTITVDKNIYLINPNTIYRDENNNTITISGFTVNDQVTVQGMTSGSENIADQINLVKKSTPISPIKIITKDKDTVTNSNLSPVTSTPQTVSPAPAIQIPTPTTPTKPLDTYGGFIIESPTGQ